MLTANAQATAENRAMQTVELTIYALTYTTDGGKTLHDTIRYVVGADSAAARIAVNDSVKAGGTVVNVEFIETFEADLCGPAFAAALYVEPDTVACMVYAMRWQSVTVCGGTAYQVDHFAPYTYVPGTEECDATDTAAKNQIRATNPDARNITIGSVYGPVQVSRRVAGI